MHSVLALAARSSRRASPVLLAALAATLAPGCRGGQPESEAAAGTAAKQVAAAAPAASKPRVQPSGRPLWSLHDNRHLAHVYQGGNLVVRFGSAGLAKYLRFGKQERPFELAQELEGRRVARMKLSQVAVVVPLGPGDQPASQLHVNLHAQAPGKLSLRVNGREFGPFPFAAGWATVSAPLPQGLLRTPGENEVVLYAPGKNTLHVEWLQIGAAPQAVAPAAADAATLSLAAGAALAYYVWVPEKAAVQAVVDDPACQVAVRAIPQGGAPVQGTLGATSPSVDLAGLAGQVVRLELSAQGCARAGLTQAALATSAPAPAAARGARPKYVVLWIMDSLRADRIKIFQPGATPEVPNFEKLAARSAVFTQAYVQGNESRASHASLWASLYPIKHGMLTGKDKLGAQWTTIDELMKKAGAWNSGVSGNGYIISRWGFGDRWDAYRNHIHDGGGVTGEAILNKALASVEGKKEPWFLYVGTIDTHVSWRAKEPWFSRYDSKPYDGRFKTEASGVDVEKIIAGKLAVTERDKERVRAIYDSNVSYQDKLVGDLMAALEKWGIADETMVIITADHGDELWEQGKVGHGQSLHEILVRVPLLIHYPALFRPGVYSEGVEVIDIVPTLADAFDIDLDPEWQGESLLALINGRGLGYPRLSMASMYEYWHVGRVGPWKLYTSGRQTPRLYRIDDDLFEAKDLAGEQPFAVRLVSDALWTLRTFNREWRKSQWGSPANLSADFGRAVGP